MLNVLKYSLIVLAISESWATSTPQRKASARSSRPTASSAAKTPQEFLERFLVDIRSKDPVALFQALSEENQKSACLEENLVKIPARKRGSLRELCTTKFTEKSAASPIAAEATKPVATEVEKKPAEVESSGRSREERVATAQATTASGAADSASFGRSRVGEDGVAASARASEQARSSSAESWGRSRDERVATAQATAASGAADSASFGRSRVGEEGVSTAQGDIGQVLADAKAPSAAGVSIFDDQKSADAHMEEGLRLEKTAADHVQRRIAILSSVRDVTDVEGVEAFLALDQAIAAHMAVNHTLLENAAQDDANATKLYNAMFGSDGLVAQAARSGRPYDAQTLTDIKAQVNQAMLVTKSSRMSASEGLTKVHKALDAFEKAAAALRAAADAKRNGLEARTSDMAAVDDLYVPEGEGEATRFLDVTKTLYSSMTDIDSVLPFSGIDLALRFHDEMLSTGSSSVSALESLMRAVDALHARVMKPRDATMSLLKVLEMNSAKVVELTGDITGYADYAKIYLPASASEKDKAHVVGIALLSGIQESVVLAKDKLVSAKDKKFAKSIRNADSIMVNIEAMEELIQKALAKSR